VGILLVGLVIEHFIAFRTNKTGPFPSGGLVIISISETVLWVIWLIIAQAVGGIGGIVAGGVFLSVTMFVQHAVEKNVFNGFGAFADLIKTEIIGFTLIEAVAASVWLWFVQSAQPVGAVVVLGVGILIEHFIQSNQPAPVANASMAAESATR
jgi:hypothetical protein